MTITFANLNMKSYDNVILHYDAGNVSSYPGTGTTVTDLSGNGYTGTLQNGVGYTSADGGAFIFDRVDDKITLSGPSLKGFYTIYIWVWPSTSDGWAALVAQNDGLQGLYYRSSENINFYGPDPVSRQSNFTLDFESWNHVAAVATPSSTVLYKNGIADTTTFNNGSPTNLIVQTIGDDMYSGGPETFGGKIAKIQIISGAASSASVLARFNYEKFRFGL